jgi:hypothetical protein
MKTKWERKNPELATVYGTDKKPVLKMQSYLKAVKDMTDYTRMCVASEQRAKGMGKNPYK